MRRMKPEGPERLVEGNLAMVYVNYSVAYFVSLCSQCGNIVLALLSVLFYV